MDSYELAYRMQMKVPAFLISVRKSGAAYGLNDDRTKDFGQRLLLARRLLERGVRFVQAYTAVGIRMIIWVNLSERPPGRSTHRGPVKADLKQRGMLDDTVVWCANLVVRRTTESAEAVNGLAVIITKTPCPFSSPAAA